MKTPELTGWDDLQEIHLACIIVNILFVCFMVFKFDCEKKCKLYFERQIDSPNSMKQSFHQSGSKLNSLSSDGRRRSAPKTTDSSTHSTHSSASTVAVHAGGGATNDTNEQNYMSAPMETPSEMKTPMAESDLFTSNTAKRANARDKASNASNPSNPSNPESHGSIELMVSNPTKPSPSQASLPPPATQPLTNASKSAPTPQDTQSDPNITNSTNASNIATIAFLSDRTGSDGPDDEMYDTADSDAPATSSKRTANKARKRTHTHSADKRTIQFQDSVLELNVGSLNNANNSGLSGTGSGSDTNDNFSAFAKDDSHIRGNPADRATTSSPRKHTTRPASNSLRLQPSHSEHLNSSITTIKPAGPTVDAVNGEDSVNPLNSVSPINPLTPNTSNPEQNQSDTAHSHHSRRHRKRHKSRRKHMKKARSARNTLDMDTDKTLNPSANDGNHGDSKRAPRSSHGPHGHHKHRKKRKSLKNRSNKERAATRSNKDNLRKRRHSSKLPKRNDLMRDLSALKEGTPSKPDPNETLFKRGAASRPNLGQLAENAPQTNSSAVSAVSASGASSATTSASNLLPLSMSEESASEDEMIVSTQTGPTAQLHKTHLGDGIEPGLMPRSATDRKEKRVRIKEVDAKERGGKGGRGSKNANDPNLGAQTESTGNGRNKKPKLSKAVSETQHTRRGSKTSKFDENISFLALNLSEVNVKGGLDTVGMNKSGTGGSSNVKELLGQIQVQMPSTWYSHRNQESFDFYDKLFKQDILASDSEIDVRKDRFEHHSVGSNGGRGDRTRGPSRLAKLSLKNVFSKNDHKNVSTAGGSGARAGMSQSVSKTLKTNKTNKSSKMVAGAAGSNATGALAGAADGTKSLAGTAGDDANESDRKASVYNAMNNNNFGMNFSGLAGFGTTNINQALPVSNDSASMYDAQTGVGVIPGIGPIGMGPDGAATLSDGGGSMHGMGGHGGHGRRQSAQTLKRGESRLMNILNSKIHEESAAKRRYRYILYIPVLVHCAMALVAVFSDDWDFLIWCYPMIEFVLGLTMWCYVDIIILSCGGSHIVQESLEVQISAQDSYYRCIYCYCCRWMRCGCDCCEGCLERCCKRRQPIQCCKFDNSYSLHRCHLALLKVILCCVAPIMLVCIGIASEINSVSDELQQIDVEDLGNWFLGRGGDHRGVPDSKYHSLYWLILILLLCLNMFCIVTAGIVSIHISYSLHHISSLNVDSLIWKYCAVFVLSCVISIQFAVIVVASTLPDECKFGVDGQLCVYISFHMLLVYLELLLANVLNYFAFKNDDFEFWGKKVIPQINIYAYEHIIDFDDVHDLYNYRKAETKDFLWEWEHPNGTPRRSLVSLYSSNNVVTSMASNVSSNNINNSQNDANNLKKRKTNTILEENEESVLNDSDEYTDDEEYGSETESSGSETGSESNDKNSDGMDSSSWGSDSDDEDENEKGKSGKASKGNKGSKGSKSSKANKNEKDRKDAKESEASSEDELESPKPTEKSVQNKKKSPVSSHSIVSKLDADDTPIVDVTATGTTPDSPAFQD